MDLIIKYFIEEKSVTEVVAKVVAKPLLKYDDIKNEFLYWLENRNYDCPKPISINGLHRCFSSENRSTFGCSRRLWLYGYVEGQSN